MIELAIGTAIAFALMAAEHLLCTKLKSPLWGGIIPLLLLVGTIWLFLKPESFRWNSGTCSRSSF